MRCLAIMWGVVCFVDAAMATPQSIQRVGGRLANSGFENARIKATLFFSGQARDGTRPYECYAAPNLGLYTVHPEDSRHLSWSTAKENRTFVVDQMVDVGLNVIAFSSWGEDFLPCTTGWSHWAPMQSSSQSHDEVFAAAKEKSILVMPFIESRADWGFRHEFPRWGSEVAPGTVNQIVNFLERYVLPGAPHSHADQWARVYDNQGQARYAVAIIHASSERLNAGEHAAFARGFDLIEQEVFRRTGKRVGFFLDVLPPGTFAPGRFKPSASFTGPHLKNEPSVLGIMCFIPEVWYGSSYDAAVINWKRQFSQGWKQTGIPFLMDVSPGYDAHRVFPDSIQYGLTLEWMMALTQMVRDFGDDGLMFNAWNGYTEGMTAVPVQEYGSVFYAWLSTLTCIHANDTCADQIRCTDARLAGDVNGDCRVDFVDLAALAQDWLESKDSAPGPGGR